MKDTNGGCAHCAELVGRAENIFRAAENLMNVLGRETKPRRSNAHNTHFGYGTSVLQRAIEAAGFSFDQQTFIRSNVHSVLMEKLWWTYPSTNRLVPFKDIVDADADADEEVSLGVCLEVSLGDDVPGTKIYKEFGYFGRINQLLQDLGEVQLNDQLWEAATDEARRKVAKLKQLKDHVTWRNERTESEFVSYPRPSS